MKYHLVVLALAISGAAIGVGCAERLPESSSEGEFVITAADSENGRLAGFFARPDGQIVHFEAAREPSEGPAADGHDGGADIDVRFFDSDGDNFILRASGHALRDPAWTRQKTVVDSEQRAKDFETVRLMIAPLEDTSLPDALAQERKALIEVATFFTSDQWREGILDDDQEFDDPPLAPTTIEERDVRAGAGADQVEPWIERNVAPLHRNGQQCQVYRHRLQIRKAPVQLVDGDRIDINIPLLDHSATIATVLDACNVEIRSSETCNHGRCASSLNASCIRTWNNRGANLPIRANCCRNAMSCGGDHCGANCCPTPYGAGSGNHVCNDDTRLQRDIMRDNGPLFCPAYCSDRPNATRAPSCN